MVAIAFDSVILQYILQHNVSVIIPLTRTDNARVVITDNIESPLMKTKSTFISLYTVLKLHKSHLLQSKCATRYTQECAHERRCYYHNFVIMAGKYS